jgi:RpiR family transcriptional regulator, carbohydrate utilization regulator
MTVYDTIRTRMNELTASEAAFADYALKREDLIYKSITLASEESGIGYGTIVRFTQKLGFSGFQDFKIHLAVEAGKGAPADEGSDWLEKSGELSARTMGTAIRALGEERLREAAEALAKARSILIAAVAGSFPVAMELAYRLSRLGLAAWAEQDSHLQMIRASLLGPSDLLFAISSSGSTKEILECAALSRDNGSRVLSLTNFAKSPLADRSDIVLNTAVREDALEAEIGTKLPFFFAVELLASLLVRIVPGAGESIRKSSNSVASRLV